MRVPRVDNRAVVIAMIAVVLSFVGGASVMMVHSAHAAATPADRADCRRDRGVPVLAPDGSVVCISRASVIWEAARR